ncbi:MAG TPA: adenylate/guanylate cyclase domain-containing protein [Candidatus Limnocylindria bacterium]|nr:adenylate/guanylate cyclase domain-containing protein [Candidatus Limnocylindria bacterium]
MAADGRLTAEELADEAGTSVERVAELAAAGVLQAGSEYTREDVPRVLVANALEEGGLSLEVMRRGIEEGIVSFEQTPLVYPDPGSPGGTVAELAAELDLPTDAVLRIITAFNLPRPAPEERLRQAHEDHLREFVAAWRPLGGEELLISAARIYGDAMRRAAEGWMELFEEAVLAPVADRVLSWEEMSHYALDPGYRVLEVGHSLLPWLLDQHRVPALNRLNFDSIERQLALIGVAPAVPREPPAIVFADLAGYTRLTEEHGDEVAATSAMRLAELADEVASAHDGRLVKLLGDGAMLHFARPVDAVSAALALRQAVAAAGLPPAHIGIHAGAVIRRESDYFGRTVNVAARLSGQAGPGEVLLTPAVVDAVRSAGEELPPMEDAGALRLKGIPEPVAALRIGPG